MIIFFKTHKAYFANFMSIKFRNLVITYYTLFTGKYFKHCCNFYFKNKLVKFKRGI